MIFMLNKDKKMYCPIINPKKLDESSFLGYEMNQKLLTEEDKNQLFNYILENSDILYNKYHKTIKKHLKSNQIKGSYS